MYLARKLVQQKIENFFITDTHLGIVPEKLLIRFNFPTLLTNDFERARMLEDGSTPTCLSKVKCKYDETPDLLFLINVNKK